MPRPSKSVFYGIRKGKGAPLVVQSWEEVVNKITGFSGAEFKKFKSKEQAKAYIKDQDDKGDGSSFDPSGAGSFTMWFDGGSRGNPGVSGSGALVFDHNEKELYSGFKYVGDNNTNNEAEYGGMILGLRAVIKLGCKRVVVKGDSMLVIQQMMGHWRVAAPKLVILHKLATELVKEAELECSWQHVSRCKNARADLLANIAADTKSDGEVFDPSTNVDTDTAVEVPDPSPTTLAVTAVTASAPSTPLPPPAIPILPGIVGCESPITASSLVSRPADASLSTSQGVSLAVSGVGATAGAASTPVASASSSVSPSSTVNAGIAAGAFSSAEARESAAVAAAAAAYAAATAHVRATIASAGMGGVGRGGDAFGVGAPGVEALVSRGGSRAPSSAEGSASVAVAGGQRGGAALEQQPKRRFMVHVASWRKTEASSRATAAVLYEEGSWRRLKVLMRVARCSIRPRGGVPQLQDGGVHGMGRQDGASSATLAGDMLRVMGQVLEEIVVLGGGKVAAVTNQQALADLLAPASPHTAWHDGYLAAIPETKLALQRWRELDGVLLEPSDQNELASVVMLARCCADPPPVSTLGWSGNNGVESASGMKELGVTAAGVAGSASVSGGNDAVGIDQGAARNGAVAGGWHASVGLGTAKGVVSPAVSPFPGFSTGGEAPEVGAGGAGGTAGPGWLKRPAPRLDGERESRYRKVDGGVVDDKLDVGGGGGGVGGGGGPSRQVQI